MLAVAALGFLALKETYPFLAITEPVTGGALVVEGWAPDYALEEMIAEFNRNHYRTLFVTGGPLEKGAPLSEYRTYAELASATLTRLGLSSNVVQAVPAPLVRKDRTYASAVALRDWLQRHGGVTNLNVVTIGPHARRTRLMFERALGPDAKVGIVALRDRDYNPDRWWTSSAGFRTVTGEMIAYGYARLLFRPSVE